MTVTSSIQFDRDLPPAPTRVVPIPKGELRVVNIDSHNQKLKGLIHIPTPGGETMWVYPDIIESQQWTIVTSRKSKGKAKIFSSNVVGISTREIEEDTTSLTSSGDEESAFAADTGAPPTLKTRSDKQYLKQYGDPIVDSPQLAEEAIEQSMRPFVKKYRASVCQSSSERRCGTINSLPF